MTLKDLIECHEGFRSHPYLDTQGIKTIGFGRNLDDVGLSDMERAYLGIPPRNIDDGITRIEGEFLLDHDIDRAIEACQKEFDWFESLDNVRMTVVVEMTFNIGIRKFRLFKKCIEYISTGDWENAAKEMLDSVWADQVHARARQLAEMMRTGEVVSG